jgi:hypothetical protein
MSPGAEVLIDPADGKTVIHDKNKIDKLIGEFFAQ